MVPAKLGLLPIYYMFQAGGLVDTHLGLILLYAASGIPFTMFVLMGFMRGLPVELEEAARLDGANDGRIFWSVILPLVRPALAVVTIFQFAPTWNDFFYPLVLLRDTDKYTIPVGLTQFFGEYSADRGTPVRRSDHRAASARPGLRVRLEADHVGPDRGISK